MRKLGNFNTDISIEADRVRKVTKQSFPSEQLADEYHDDLAMYVERLSADGFAIPEVFASGVDATCEQKVFQESAAIEGSTILDSPSIEKITTLSEHLRSLPLDKDGTFVTPPDFGLGNFMHDDQDKMWLIDTIPPYIDLRTNTFPYYRMNSGDSITGRSWTDRYFRSCEGASTRLVAMGARALVISPDNDVDFRSACYELSLNTPNRARTIARDLPVFFAATVAMRALHHDRKKHSA